MRKTPSCRFKCGRGEFFRAGFDCCTRPCKGKTREKNGNLTSDVSAELLGRGAERVNVNLAPELTRRGFEVTFVVNKMQGGLVPIIPPRARVVSLDAKRTLSALLPLVRFLRRERPDVLLANIGPINIIALWAKVLAGVKTRVVVTQHSSLSHESKTRNWQLKITPAMYRLFLWQAAGVVAVSGGIGDELATMAHIPRERVTVINNPVIMADFNQRLDEVVDHPWLLDRVPFLLGVGRLVGDKDFETLLAASACSCWTIRGAAGAWANTRAVAWRRCSTGRTTAKSISTPTRSCGDRHVRHRRLDRTQGHRARRRDRPGDDRRHAPLRARPVVLTGEGSTRSSPDIPSTLMTAMRTLYQSLVPGAFTTRSSSRSCAPCPTASDASDARRQLRRTRFHAAHEPLSSTVSSDSLWWQSASSCCCNWASSTRC